jgi:hypothetical protein
MFCTLKRRRACMLGRRFPYRTNPHLDERQNEKRQQRNRGGAGIRHAAQLV